MYLNVIYSVSHIKSVFYVAYFLLRGYFQPNKYAKTVMVAT